MSGYIISAYDDCIHMLTDAAQYNQHGVLTGIVSKVWKSETLPIAITGRGYRQLVDAYATLFLDIAGDAGSVDAAIGAWPAALDTLRDARHGGTFSLIVGAWSETGGPKVFGCTDHVHSSRDDVPYTLMERRFGAFHMGDDVNWDDVYSLASVSLDSSEFLVRHGADLMEMMRRRPSTLAIEHPDQKLGQYSVGGRCDLTTITAEGVTVRTVRTWPDKIGERINPFAQEGNILPLLNHVQGNRKQRRMAAARARCGKVA